MTYIFHDDPTERTNNHYSGVNIVNMCVENATPTFPATHVVAVEPFVQCGETYKELNLIILKDGLSFISPKLKKINDYQNMPSPIMYHFISFDDLKMMLHNNGLNEYAISYINMLTKCTNPIRMQIDSTTLLEKQLELTSQYIDKMEDIANHYDQLNKKIEKLSDDLSTLRKMSRF